MERIYKDGNDLYNHPVVYLKSGELYYDSAFTKKVETKDVFGLFVAGVLLCNGTTYTTATKCTKEGVISWAQ